MQTAVALKLSCNPDVQSATDWYAAKHEAAAAIVGRLEACRVLERHMFTVHAVLKKLPILRRMMSACSSSGQ